MSRILLATVGLGALLATWTIASCTAPAWLLPPPWLVAARLWTIARHGTGLDGTSLGTHVLASSARVLGGFAIGAGAGILAGLLSGSRAWLAGVLDPPLLALRAIPGIAWLPLALLWFGASDRTAIFLIALAVLFPVFLATRDGVRGIPHRIIDTGRMLGLGRTALVWHVVLPACRPRILTGLRIGLGLAWAYVVLGEMTGADKGLGATIMDGRQQGDATLVIAGMAVVAAMGVSCDLIFRWGTRRWTAP